jgi:hypothetical protein
VLNKFMMVLNKFKATFSMAATNVEASLAQSYQTGQYIHVIKVLEVK